MTARPTLIFDQPAFVETKTDFAVQRGQQVVFTIYRQFAPSFAPLTENQDVTAGSIQDYQVNFSINEYGFAVGTTEKLDLLSYHGPISNMVRTLLGPHMANSMDRLARNTYWNAQNRTGGVAFRDYASGGTTRTSLSTSSVITADLVRLIAYNLSVRRVPLVGLSDPGYLALCHPAVIYDLRGDANWKNAQLYAGATRIFNGEEGMIHGVRFLKSDQARIANGGVLSTGNVASHPSQTTLSASYPAGVTSITVADATSYSVGMEVTLHNTGTATTATIAATSTSWTAPDGKDTTAEEVIISGISGNTITFTQKTLLPHSIGDFMTDALDVYPIVFIGGVPALGKGIAVAPEIRVSLPTDKLRRTSYIGLKQAYGPRQVAQAA